MQMPESKHQEFMSTLFPNLPVKLEGYPDHNIHFNPDHDVVVTRYATSDKKTYAVWWMGMDEFMGTVTDNDGQFDFSKVGTVFVTFEDGVNKGLHSLIAELSDELPDFDWTVTPKFTSSVYTPKTLVLGNSEHPVKRYGLTANKVPGLDKTYYIVADGKCVVLNTYDSWIAMFDSLDEVKSMVESSKSLNVNSVPLDPSNKYYGNDVMTILANT